MHPMPFRKVDGVSATSRGGFFLIIITKGIAVIGIMMRIGCCCVVYTLSYCSADVTHIIIKVTPYFLLTGASML